MVLTSSHDIFSLLWLTRNAISRGFNWRSQARRWKWNQSFQGRRYDEQGVGIPWKQLVCVFLPLSYFADSVAASNSAYCLSEGFSEKLKLDYDQRCTEEKNWKLSFQLREEKWWDQIPHSMDWSDFLYTLPEFICSNSLSSGNQTFLKVVPLWTGFSNTWLCHSANGIHYSQMLSTLHC